MILARLHASTSAEDMDLPRIGLHELSEKRKDIWSVTVSANWRIAFDYEDFHQVN